jgi:hypothetical protein
MQRGLHSPVDWDAVQAPTRLRTPDIDVQTWGKETLPRGWLSHNDSLPGIRSVMDAIVSRGGVLRTFRDSTNKISVSVFTTNGPERVPRAVIFPQFGSLDG